LNRAARARHAAYVAGIHVFAPGSARKTWTAGVEPGTDEIVEMFAFKRETRQK
jgi:hypothetical protein